MDSKNHSNPDGIDAKVLKYSEILPEDREKKLTTISKLTRKGPTTKPGPSPGAITTARPLRTRRTNRPTLKTTQPEPITRRTPKPKTSVRPSILPTARPTTRTTDASDEVPLEIYIGAAVGGAIFLFLLILIIVCCLRRKRRNTIIKRSHPPHGSSTNGIAVQYRVQSTNSENILLVSEHPQRDSDELGYSDQGRTNQAMSPSPLLIPCNGRHSNAESLSPSSPEKTRGQFPNFSAVASPDNVFPEMDPETNNSFDDSGYVPPDFVFAQGHENGSMPVNVEKKSQTLSMDRPSTQNVSIESKKRLSWSHLKWRHSPPVIHGLKPPEDGLYVPMEPNAQSINNPNSNHLTGKDLSRKFSLPVEYLAHATPPKRCGSIKSSSYVNMDGRKQSCPSPILDDPQGPYEAIFITPEKATTLAPKITDGRSLQDIEPTENYENIRSLSAQIEKHRSDLDLADMANSLRITSVETRRLTSSDVKTEATVGSPTQNAELEESKSQCTDSLYDTPAQTPDANSENEASNSVYGTPAETPDSNRKGNSVTADNLQNTPTPTPGLNMKSNETGDSVYDTPTQTHGLNRKGNESTESMYDTPTQTPGLNRRQNEDRDSLYDTPTQTPGLIRRQNEDPNSLYDTPTQTPDLSKMESKLKNRLPHTTKQRHEINKRRSDDTEKVTHTLNREDDNFYPNVIIQPMIRQGRQENDSIAQSKVHQDPADHLYEQNGEHYSNTSVGNEEDYNSDSENVYDMPSPLGQDVIKESAEGERCSSSRASRETETKSQELYCSPTDDLDMANVYSNTVSTPRESTQQNCTPDESTYDSAAYYVEQSHGTCYVNTSFLSAANDSSKNDHYEVPGSVFVVDPKRLNSAQKSSHLTKENTPEVTNLDVSTDERVTSDLEQPDPDTENVYDIPQSFMQAGLSVQKPGTSSKPAPAPKPKKVAFKKPNSIGSSFDATPIASNALQSQVDGSESKATNPKKSEILVSKSDNTGHNMKENASKKTLILQSQTRSSETPTHSVKSVTDKSKRERDTNSKEKGMNTDESSDHDSDINDDDTGCHSYVNVEDVVRSPTVMQAYSSDTNSTEANKAKSPKSMFRYLSVDNVHVPVSTPVSKVTKPIYGKSKSPSPSSRSFDMSELEQALQGVRDRKS